MYLKKLELKGFKSFRDKTVLEFPNTFSMIVGPNGSGKSNITEAVCFVLGKSRGLRASNLQELIFNGGTRENPAEKAIVSITLKDDAKESREYRISRKVDRDGSSVYKLDDKVVTRQKIIDLVGDNEYNIILQDDIIKVVGMRSVERRQVIDELCGIAEYDKKKEKALHELEKAETRINEANIILGEKTGRLQELKKERDDALRYQQLQKDLKNTRGSLMHRSILRLEKKTDEYNREGENLAKEKEGCLKRVAEIREHQAKLTDGVRKINSRILELEGSKKDNRITEIRGEINRKSDLLRIMEERLQSISRDIAEKENKREGYALERGKIESELNSLKSSMRSLEEEIGKEAERIGDLKLEKDIDSLRNSIFDLKSQIKTLVELKGKTLGDIKSRGDERALLEQELQRITGAEKNAREKILAYEKENREHLEKLEKAKRGYDGLSQDVEELRKKTDSRQIELASKTSELKTLEQASGSNAVKAIMKLKEVMPGIYGTVAQLGEVTKKEYENSLQVAAGNRAHNIVVEDVDTAAKCIQYLRTKEVGRATFLPLDRINVKTRDNPPDGALGFARDFIKTDKKKFEKVFQHVFGDTILVEDLEKAKKIGIGEWRMVTLDCDLLEHSGAMTGGFFRREEAEIVFSNLEALESRIKGLESEIGRLGRERSGLLESLKKARLLVSETEKLLNSVQSKLTEERLMLANLSERKKETESRVSKLSETIESLGKEVASGESKAKELDKQAAVKEAEFREKMQVRAGFDTTQLDELKDRYRDLEVKRNGFKQSIELLEQQSKEINKEIIRLEDSKKDTAKEAKGITSQISELEKSLAEAEREGGKIIDEIGDLIKKRSDSENKIVDLGAEVGRIEVQLEKAKEKMNGITVEKAKIETKLEDLRKEFQKYSDAELLSDKKLFELESMLSQMEEELTKFGSINMKAIETYEIIKTEVEDIAQKLETLKNERQSIFDFMDKIERRKYEVFMETFDVVKRNFEEMFPKLSNGGHGTLLLDNPKEISQSGLFIKASPGGKKIMSLDAMSGGEKVLTSSAFLLAIQQYKPSCFYIVDELDAALDKENSILLAEMLKNSQTQFIMVTHNDAVMRYADSIIGVSMTNGVSQIVGVKLT